MCGFAGYFETHGLSRDAHDVIMSMAKCLQHRGPDDDSYWIDRDAGLALGFRRLAILELSDSGKQPMLSASGRYVIVFNGEIYNHLEIRDELGASAGTWRGSSDTETLLEAIERWGLEATLGRLVGMFAFALWDRKDRLLTLARDRAGEKPLYYGWCGSTFLFASELKALRPHPSFSPTIDHGSVSMYLRHGYVPSPFSIYEGFFKLAPGHFLRLHVEDANGPEAHYAPQAYWSVKDAAERGMRRPFSGSDEEAAERLEELLANSVALQRIADVPLGAFLSGGIDSSLVTALMQSQTSLPVKTFTIGFAEAEYDESPYARAVADRLGTDHTELAVSAQEALSVVEYLPKIYDEPFGDSSAIPTLLVSRLARQSVTVALSGDAGDELFAGYGRYHRAYAAWRRIQGFPGPARAALGTVARAAESAGALLGADRLLIRKLQSISAATHDRIGHLYLEQMSLWKRPERVLRRAVSEHPSVLKNPSQQVGATPIEQMMFTDFNSYLPGDVLTKVDRAAMAVSLETRVPMLDHRVVEFAWSLPLEFKVRNGESKWLLKRVLEKHVPRELFERPKMGFGVPIDQWLRGPLRGWADDLLAENLLGRQGVFDPKAIRGLWLDHLTGLRDWQYLLWPVLMFQMWLANEETGMRPS